MPFWKVVGEGEGEDIFMEVLGSFWKGFWFGFEFFWSCLGVFWSFCWCSLWIFSFEASFIVTLLFSFTFLLSFVYTSTVMLELIGTLTTELPKLYLIVWRLAFETFEILLELNITGTLIFYTALELFFIIEPSPPKENL